MRLYSLYVSQTQGKVTFRIIPKNASCLTKLPHGAAYHGDVLAQDSAHVRTMIMAALARHMPI